MVKDMLMLTGLDVLIRPGRLCIQRLNNILSQTHSPVFTKPNREEASFAGQRLLQRDYFIECINLNQKGGQFPHSSIMQPTQMPRMQATLPPQPLINPALVKVNTPFRSSSHSPPPGIRGPITFQPIQINNLPSQHPHFSHTPVHPQNIARFQQINRSGSNSRIINQQSSIEYLNISGAESRQLHNQQALNSPRAIPQSQVSPRNQQPNIVIRPPSNVSNRTDSSVEHRQMQMIQQSKSLDRSATSRTNFIETDRNRRGQKPLSVSRSSPSPPPRIIQQGGSGPYQQHPFNQTTPNIQQQVNSRIVHMNNQVKIQDVPHQQVSQQPQQYQQGQLPHAHPHPQQRMPHQIHLQQQQHFQQTQKQLQQSSNEQQNLPRNTQQGQIGQIKRRQENNKPVKVYTSYDEYLREKQHLSEQSQKHTPDQIIESLQNNINSRPNSQSKQSQSSISITNKEHEAASNNPSNIQLDYSQPHRSQDSSFSAASNEKYIMESVQEKPQPQHISNTLNYYISEQTHNNRFETSPPPQPKQQVQPKGTPAPAPKGGDTIYSHSSTIQQGVFSKVTKDMMENIGNNFSTIPEQTLEYSQSIDKASSSKINHSQKTDNQAILKEQFSDSGDKRQTTIKNSKNVSAGVYSTSLGANNFQTNQANQQMGHSYSRTRQQNIVGQFSPRTARPDEIISTLQQYRSEKRIENRGTARHFAMDENVQEIGRGMDYWEMINRVYEKELEEGIRRINEVYQRSSSRFI